MAVGRLHSPSSAEGKFGRAAGLWRNGRDSGSQKVRRGKLARKLSPSIRVRLLRGDSTNAVSECILNRVAHHVIVLRSQKASQAVGVHDVFAGHVGNGLGRNGGNLLLPQK